MASQDTSNQKPLLLKTVYSVLDGYNKWDIETILGPRTPDCTQQVLPARLERPPLTNAEYREYFTTSVMPYFKGFVVEVLDAIEDPAAHKVALHARSRAETVVGNYANEYVLIMHTTEDDTQVHSIKEFVDSGYSAEFFPKLRAHLAQS